MHLSNHFRECTYYEIIRVDYAAKVKSFIWTVTRYSHLLVVAIMEIPRKWFAMKKNIYLSLLLIWYYIFLIYLHFSVKEKIPNSLSINLKEIFYELFTVFRFYCKNYAWFSCHNFWSSGFYSKYSNSIRICNVTLLLVATSSLQSLSFALFPPDHI